MTHLIADPFQAGIHPLRVLDLPAAGYILDLAREFGCDFDWRFDAESLSGLVQLAMQHVPGLEIRSCDALIRRLQLAGDLVQGDRGLEVTPGGRERCRSTFHALLTAPEWRQAIDQIREELSVFSETEGIPLMAGGLPAAGRQAAMSFVL